MTGYSVNLWSTYRFGAGVTVAKNDAACLFEYAEGQIGQGEDTPLTRSHTNLMVAGMVPCPSDMRIAVRALRFGVGGGSPTDVQHVRGRVARWSFGETSVVDIAPIRFMTVEDKWSTWRYSTARCPCLWGTSQFGIQVDPWSDHTFSTDTWLTVQILGDLVMASMVRESPIAELFGDARPCYEPDFRFWSDLRGVPDDNDIEDDRDQEGTDV